MVQVIFPTHCLFFLTSLRPKNGIDNWFIKCNIPYQINVDSTCTCILAYLSIWYLTLNTFQSPWHIKRALPVSFCIPFSFGMIWLAVMLSSIMLCFSSLIPRDIAEGGLLNSSLNNEAPTLCILFLAFQSLQRPLSQEMPAGKKISYLGMIVLWKISIHVLCNVFWSISFIITLFI